MKNLDAATGRYRRSERAHDKARDEVIEAIVAALKADVPPTEVAAHSPFTATYVRNLAREADIPPAKPGIKPRKKTEN